MTNDIGIPIQSAIACSTDSTEDLSAMTHCSRAETSTAQETVFRDTYGDRRKKLENQSEGR